MPQMESSEVGKIPFRVWKYTLLRIMCQLTTVATFVFFLIMQNKYPKFFMPSLAFVGLGIFNFVFFCLAHHAKVALMKNYAVFIVIALISVGLLVWNIVYMAKLR